MKSLGIWTDAFAALRTDARAEIESKSKRSRGNLALAIATLAHIR